MSPVLHPKALVVSAAAAILGAAAVLTAVYVRHSGGKAKPLPRAGIEQRIEKEMREMKAAADAAAGDPGGASGSNAPNSPPAVPASGPAGPWSPESGGQVTADSPAVA